MDKELHVLEIQFTEEEWEQIAQYFSKYTAIDIQQIPARYQRYVMPAREIMKSEARILLKYAVIDRLDEERSLGIKLENGAMLTDAIIQKAYAEAKKILFFVASVVNIDEILETHPKKMEKFFLEYWAVSMLGVAKARMKKILEEMLKESMWKQTSVWSPGQAHFELENQQILFDILKPEAEGIRLDHYMRMLPLKTVSGTIGIVSKDATINMISCDYCEHAQSCPSYEGVRFQDMKHRRLR